MKKFKNHQLGISLVELLLVITTIGILVALIANLPPSLVLIGKSAHQSLASQIATEQIEDTRELTYENLASGETNITDSRINLLPAGDGKILIEDCDSVNICTQNENMKQITVTVTWKESEKEQKVEFKTLVGSGGLK